jgi:phage terminase small subunit
MAGKPALSPKQERFCLEYLKDLNGTQAAIRTGYSARTANEQAARLLAKASVSARVQQLLAKRNEKLELKADDILRELLRIAQVDIAKIYDADGLLLPIHEMPEDVRRAIAGVEVTEVGDDDRLVRTKRIRFWDKTKALELLAKVLKLLTENVNVSGSLNLEQLLAKAGQPKEKS